MIIRRTLTHAALVLLLGSTVLFGTSSRQSRIVATILPLRDFAAAVAGERGEAVLLLPPGAPVHTWQFRPGDLLDLQSCDLFIHIGAGLEPWVPDILQAMPRKSLEVLEASRGLQLIGAGPHTIAGPVSVNPDPHVWLDFSLDLMIVDRIESALGELDPEGKAVFAANAESLRRRLRDLDTRFKTSLGRCRSRDLVVAGHGAFAYLARRYGLIQKSVYGLSPDAQPRPRQVIEIIEYCRRENIETVFFENSVPRDVARVLAEEIGGRILTLNTGHNLSADQLRKGLDFFDLMEDNLSHLKEGLSCR